jgi:hypothetical protein
MVEKRKSERTSRYPELEKPEPRSTIPPHLLGKLSDQERWIIESLSRMESVHAWLVKAALDGNRADIENDLRTQELEDWKAMVCSKWAVVGGFLLLILPILLQKLADHLAK